MPIYRIQTQPDNLTKLGPIVPVEISQPQALVDYLTEQGKPVPSPITGNALIDTGASRSAIDSSVIKKLDIGAVGVTTVGTAGGTARQNLFPASLKLANHLKIEISPVLGANLASLKINALIGRDILRHFLMIYHGNDGMVILSV